MNVSPDVLRKETVALIRDIELQIDEVKKIAASLDARPEELRDMNGNWPMSSLLQAKAQAYNTLVMLQTPKK